jgi:hypothetical protein
MLASQAGAATSAAAATSGAAAIGAAAIGAAAIGTAAIGAAAIGAAAIGAAAIGTAAIMRSAASSAAVLGFLTGGSFAWKRKMAFLLVAVPCTGCTQTWPADPPALPASAFCQPKWRMRSSSLARRFWLLACLGAAALSAGSAGACPPAGAPSPG